MMKRLLVLPAALLALLPGQAWACAVCIGAFDKNRLAFVATTALLTALPLSLVGGLVAYLRRRAREAAKAESED